METLKKILTISFKEIHKDLNISPDFIASIHEEKNSWSFISKFAQFIEGFFTRILVQHLNEDKTYRTVSNLPQIVRLNLAFELNLITEEQKFLFLTIAEIRNDYIHNISNVAVSLSGYLKTLKANRLNEIYKRFKDFTLGEDVDTKEKFVDDCVNSIFTACTLEIARINGNILGTIAKAKHEQRRAKNAMRLLPEIAEGAMFIEDGWMVHDYITQARDVLNKAGVYKTKFIKPPEST